MDISRPFRLLAASSAPLVAQSGSSLVTPTISPGYVSITAHGRVHRVVSNAIGPANLIAGALVAGQSTWANSPQEYWRHWDGFGKRRGLRLAGRTKSQIEAGLGSIWGEDPRYFRTSGQTFEYRLVHVFRMRLAAHDRAGTTMPAYARYVSIPAGTLLSNAWGPDSQTQMADVIGRIPFSLVSPVIGNAFSELKLNLLKRFARRKTLSNSGNFASDPAMEPDVK